RLLLLQNLQQPVAQRRWADVENAVDDAKRALPNSADVPIMSAEVQAAQNHLERGLTILRDACKAHPENVALWTTQAALLQRSGDAPKALELLDQTQRQPGDSVALRLARARHWAARRDEPAEAKTTLAELAEHIDTFRSEDQIQLLEGLAEAALRQGAAD